MTNMANIYFIVDRDEYYSDNVNENVIEGDV